MEEVHWVVLQVDSITGTFSSLLRQDVIYVVN
jgi:hypothetical protein